MNHFNNNNHNHNRSGQVRSGQVTLGQVMLGRVRRFVAVLGDNRMVSNYFGFIPDGLVLFVHG